MYNYCVPVQRVIPYSYPENEDKEPCTCGGCFYASAVKRAKALCSLVVRPSRCPDVQLSVRPSVRSCIFVLRQHGPAD